jgi:arylsulfatase A-like enzyme
MADWPRSFVAFDVINNLVCNLTLAPTLYDALLNPSHDADLHTR